MTLDAACDRARPARRSLGIAALAGAGLFLVGLWIDPGDAWAGYLAGFQLFVGLALAGPLFVALLRLTGARWSDPFLPFLRGTARLLPFVPALGLGLLFGVSQLYPWSHDFHGAASHGHGAHKEAWLTLAAFGLRTLALPALWFVAARKLLAPDATADRPTTIRRAAGFVALFGVTYSLASFDWLKSLTPHWVSAIFALDAASGLVLGGLAATVVGAVALERAGALRPRPDAAAWNDVGKLTLAFSLFWAYVAYCQYGLIWYANLPEETPRYLARAEGGFPALVLANVALNWAAPFALLLARAARASPSVLLRVAVVLLVGRALDLWLHVAPAVAGAAPLPGVGALGAFAAAAAFAARLLIDGALAEAALGAPLRGADSVSGGPARTEPVRALRW